jgi:hypothetical protein
MESSKGGSIRATRSSNYSLAPLNSNRVRAGRTVRTDGGGRRLSRRSGRDRGDSNSIVRDLRLVNAARLVASVSGENVPGTRDFPKGKVDEVSCGQKKFWKHRDRNATQRERLWMWTAIALRLHVTHCYTLICTYVTVTRHAAAVVLSGYFRRPRMWPLSPRLSSVPRVGSTSADVDKGHLLRCPRG